ncbi:MAG: TnpV protein [Oscillospiraceae bacterium]|nr:TnpV protein [Oscillospiraceae bacterium]
MENVSYHREGDYLLPNLLPPPVLDKSVGIWGQRLLFHIKEHRKCEHATMLLRGTLYQHATEVNEMGFCNEVFATLDKVVDRLCDTICALSTETIHSITARSWIISCFN